jgi:hypothetical protein
MNRRPQFVFVGDEEISCDESYTATEVYESDEEWIDTGLLDACGAPIRRRRETVKFGFVP